ncbi:hypothetical protein HQ533_03675 [Candidatus Woesearchaeota archaeon]|nr:hypothetical protein [Candidatus Woesearchaeota archaeon]
MEKSRRRRYVLADEEDSVIGESSEGAADRMKSYKELGGEVKKSKLGRFTLYDDGVEED